MVHLPGTSACCRSSSIARLTIAAISKSGPAACRLSAKMSILYGEQKIGSQPSKASAASATFFAPSAPSTTGMRLRSGCVMLFSGLPRPMPVAHGRSYWAPWNSTGSSRAITWRKIWIHSRVRSSGFVNGCPYQPSTTCGPDTPTPRISRPLEM